MEKVIQYLIGALLGLALRAAIVFWAGNAVLLTYGVKPLTFWGALAVVLAVGALSPLNKLTKET